MIGSGGSVNYLRFLITGDSSGLEAEVEKTKRTVSGMVDSISSSVGQLGTLLGGVFAGVSVSAFVGKLVSVQREFDVLNSSLVTVSGSAAAAGREMQWLKSFAKETPYGLSQATEAFVKMKALGLDPTQAKLTSFGNTAAAMGKNLMQLIEAVADASTGEFERLKEFGIKASKQGEQVAFTFQGVTTNVKNSAKDITAYLEGIGNTAFGGAMERRAKTLDGAIAGLSDSWDELFRKFSESTGFADAAASGVRKVSDAIDGLGNAVQKHQGVVMGLLGGLGGAAAVAGLMAIGAAIGAVKVALVGLSGILLANPATAALLGIGAAVGVGIAAVNAHAKTAEGIKDAIETLRFENERSEVAMERATAAGRTAGADNIAKTIEARKDQIAKLRAELDMLNANSKGAGGGRGSINPPTVAEAAAQKAQEDAKAEATLAEIRRELYNVNKDYIPQLQKLQELRQTGKIGEAEYIELVTKLAKENYKEDESTKARAASAKQLHTAYVNLADSIDEKIAAQKLEISGGQKLGESDKLRIKYVQDLQDSLKGLSASERASIEAKLKSLKQLEKENEARKVSLRLAEEERKFREEWWAAQARGVEELESGNKGLREEIELIGLSAVEQAKVLRQREEIILLTKEQQLAEMQRAEDAQGFMSRERINLEQEIVLRRERLALTDLRGARTASAQAAAASVEEWRRGVDQIGQSLADQLMEGGKGFGDYLKNLGRTLVFRPVIQAVVQGGAAAGLNMLGLPGSQMMGLPQGGGMSNALLNNMGALGAGAQALWGLSAGASTASLAAANAVGAVGGDAIGALITGNGGWAGVAAEGAAAGAGSLMSTLGAAAPWIAGGLAVASLLGGSFGSRGANHAGAAYSTTGAGNDKSAEMLFGRAAGDWYDDLTKRYNSGLEKQLGKSVDALSSVYQSLAKYAGDSAKQIDIVAGFATNSAYGDEDNYGYFRLIDKINGDVLKDYTARDGVLGTDQTQAYAKFVAEMGGELVAQLKAADIPGWMRDVFNGLGEEITSESLTAAIQQIAALDSTLVGMRRNLQGFGTLADSTFTALLKHAGGLEKLSAGVSAYYENFYSEGERAANVTRDVTEALAAVGIEMPRTRAEFRAIVEANTALGDAGARTVATMLGVADAFASVVPAAESAADAVSGVLSQAMQGMLKDRRQLEAELLKANGDTAGYTAAMRAIAIEGLAPAEVAAYDYNQALRDQISALETAKTKAAEAEAEQKRIAAERYGLETRLLGVLGDTAALRQRELAALDASSRAIQEHIWAVEDAQAAYAAATTAAQSAYSGLERSVSAQKSVLQEQYNTQKSALQDQYAASKEAWQAQVSAAQTAASEMRSIVSMLEKAFDSVQIETPELNRARIDAAQSLILNASNLNDVRAAGLEDALGVVSGNTARVYGKWEEWAFQQGITAAAVGNLYGESKKQLTAQEQVIAQLQASDALAQSISNTEIAKLDEWYQQELGVLDATLANGKEQINALLGIDERVLSVVDAVAKLSESIAAAEAARAAADAAKTAAMQAAMSAAAGGGGGSSGTGQYYTDAGDNKVELLAGQSMAYFQALSQSGTTAVSGLGELKDRLTALGKSDVWDTFASSLKLSTSDFSDSSVKHPLITDAAGNIIAVGRWDETNPIDWAKSQGVLGATASGAGGALSGAQTWTYADIAKEVQNALAQGQSASSIISSGMSNYGVSAADIKAASEQAGISGFSVENLINGSHANGLAFVPFDDYIARLHKGERVMTADENKIYSSGLMGINILPDVFSANIDGENESWDDEGGSYSQGYVGTGNSDAYEALSLDFNSGIEKICSYIGANITWSAAIDRKLNHVVQNDAVNVRIVKERS